MYTYNARPLLVFGGCNSMIGFVESDHGVKNKPQNKKYQKYKKKYVQ